MPPCGTVPASVIPRDTPRPRGAGPAPASDVQLEPFHCHVSPKYVPLNPPKRITLPPSGAAAAYSRPPGPVADDIDHVEPFQSHVSA